MVEDGVTHVHEVIRIVAPEARAAAVGHVEVVHGNPADGPLRRVESRRAARHAHLNRGLGGPTQRERIQPAPHIGHQVGVGMNRVVGSVEPRLAQRHRLRRRDLPDQDRAQVDEQAGAAVGVHRAVREREPAVVGVVHEHRMHELGSIDERVAVALVVFEDHVVPPTLEGVRRGEVVPFQEAVEVAQVRGARVPGGQLQVGGVGVRAVVPHRHVELLAGDRARVGVAGIPDGGPVVGDASEALTEFAAEVEVAAAAVDARSGRSELVQVAVVRSGAAHPAAPRPGVLAVPG